jgi:hypothetical protein
VEGKNLRKCSPVSLPQKEQNHPLLVVLREVLRDSVEANSYRWFTGRSFLNKKRGILPLISPSDTVHPFNLSVKRLTLTAKYYILGKN